MAYLPALSDAGKEYAILDSMQNMSDSFEVDLGLSILREQQSEGNV